MLNTKQQEFVDYALKVWLLMNLSLLKLKEAIKHFGNKYAYQWLIKNLTIKLVSLYLNSTESE
ncbi:MAG: hypothetical protein CM15mV27_0910 [Caudoviricetes sp.]|nr:MAG: hypothetical protein CM15mV27_0910 [Caudoviricetes sp.]